MKLNRTFLFVLFVLAVLLFGLRLTLPQRFVWKPTFSTADRQPFGCYVVDSMLRHDLPHGYRTTRQTLWQLNREMRTKQQKENVLYVNCHFRADSLSMVAIDGLLHQGATVLLVTTADMYGEIVPADSLLMKRFGVSTASVVAFSIQDLQQQIKAHSEYLKDTIYWDADSVYPRASYEFYSMLVTTSIDTVADTVSRGWRTMAYYEAMETKADTTGGFQEVTSEDGHEVKFDGAQDNVPIVMQKYPVVVRRRVGRGELIVCCMPLAMTNYSMLDGHSHRFLYRLVTQIASRPVVRVEPPEAEMSDEAQATPFRVLLSQPPLRWALYLSLALIVLFFIFTARRRQRAIPVITPPRNRSLEFTQLIGTLYHQRHDHAALVRSATDLFAQRLRHDMDVDIFDTDDNDRTFLIVSRRTGRPYEEVAALIRRLRLIFYGDTSITEPEMKRLIDQMELLFNASS